MVDDRWLMVDGLWFGGSGSDCMSEVQVGARVMDKWWNNYGNNDGKSNGKCNDNNDGTSVGKTYGNN